MAVLPVGIGSEVGAGGYQIERSLRFNSTDSAYLNRTPASAGNRKTFTYSCWVKRGLINAAAHTFGITAAAGGSDPRSEMEFDGTANEINIGFNPSGSQWFESFTNAVFRDPSAWYHIVVSVDMTQATDTNRLKVYVNGVVQTFRVYSVPSQNTDLPINNNIAHSIGRYQAGGTSHLNGYLTEINFIDGQALTPSSFGEFNEDTGVWQPKAYTGSYGTNGFYLDFADNSGTTSTTLGADSSGNGNNWTPNNFSVTAGAGNDSLVDSPTRYGTDTGAGGTVRGNYATWNPLNADGTFANGNLDGTTGTSGSRSFGSTLGVRSGKWYAEITVGTTTEDNMFIGVVNASYNAEDGNARPYTFSDNVGYFQNGTKYVNSANSAYGATYATNDIIGIAINFDSNETTFYKNNVSQGAISKTFSGDYILAIGSGSSVGGQTAILNAGQRPFAYTAPSGFKALVTTNLPTPTIEDGGEYFNAVLYTGNATARTITGVGFQPDFVWVKSRNTTWNHALFDAVRGTTKYLESNTTSSEFTNANTLTAFGSDGFSVGIGSIVNSNNDTYVAWNWKANGAGVSNTAGTITSTVSVNTTSGFSIVTYTGNATNSTVGHGLGVAPSMVIVKSRTTGDEWPVYHSGLTSASYYVLLNQTIAETSSVNFWNNTAPTSSVFSLGIGANTNRSGANLVAYCFAPVAGYSAFGKYTGNGSNDGVFVYTGFRPRWILVKRTDSTSGWHLYDTSRDTYNAATKRLQPDLSNAENTANGIIDILSNGWKFRNTNTDWDASGGTYIYAAFAENPFAYSLAR